jgi:hypothetical protein
VRCNSNWAAVGCSVAGSLLEQKGQEAARADGMRYNPSTMNIVLIVAVWMVTVLLSLLIGGYLKGYMKKKGENLATHEDIDNLVDQIRAVTQTQKDIEAKISGELWDRQKRWELKRDILIEAVRALAEVDDSLLSYSTVLKTNDPDWNEAKHERQQRWSRASSAFEGTRLLIAIVCDETTKEVFDNFGVLANQIAAGISQKDASIYDNSRKDVALKLFATRAAARKEVGTAA